MSEAQVVEIIANPYMNSSTYACISNTEEVVVVVAVVVVVGSR